MILDVLFLIIILLVFTGLGRRILKLTGFEFRSLMEEIVFSFGLGIGIAALLVLGIGLLGGLKAWIFYILLLILLAVSVFDIKYIIINSVKLLLSFVKKLN
ncbi:hypothetical protein GF312_21960, partial [Candidatus Poribacteria bacterium]|nr:hypothetical protein [Candidatus Poribacteria bacterium]